MESKQNFKEFSNALIKSGNLVNCVLKHRTVFCGLLSLKQRWNTIVRADP